MPHRHEFVISDIGDRSKDMYLRRFPEQGFVA